MGVFNYHQIPQNRLDYVILYICNIPVRTEFKVRQKKKQNILNKSPVLNKITMVFNALILLTFVSSFSCINSLMCYNCGYLELPDGEKVPVTEDFGKIPFCDDFATNDNNTVVTFPVSLYCIFIRFIMIRK